MSKYIRTQINDKMVKVRKGKNYIGFGDNGELIESDYDYYIAFNDRNLRNKRLKSEFKIENRKLYDDCKRKIRKR